MDVHSQEIQLSRVSLSTHFNTLSVPLPSQPASKNLKHQSHLTLRTYGIKKTIQNVVYTLRKFRLSTFIQMNPKSKLKKSLFINAVAGKFSTPD